MKKNEKKVLRSKLLTAIKRVLRDNKDELKKKTIDAINTSIKKIVKKTDKKVLVVRKKRSVTS